MPFRPFPTPATVVAVAVLVAAPLSGCGESPRGSNNNNNNGGATLNTTSCQDLPGPCSTTLTAIPLTGCSVSDYTMPVKVGNQTFALTVDTGSSTLAVAASSCSSCGVSPEYTPGANANNTGKNASADYGGGEGWTGTVYDDNVVVAAGVPDVDMAFASITAETIQQTGAVPFFSPSYCTGSPVNNDDQGILGLGGPGAGAINTDAFMVKLAATSTPPVFTIQMCDVNGVAWFGGYDPSYLASVPMFTPLTNANNYYDVTLSDVQLGSKSLGISTANTGLTIVDTGTSIIVLNQTAFTKLASAVQANTAFSSLFGSTFLSDPSQGCVLAPQGLTATQLNQQLPTMTLVFPGKNGEDVQLELPATESYLTPVLGGPNAVGYCQGILSQPDSTPGIVIGNSALHSYITIFDRQNMQIGFAKQSKCTFIGD